MKGPVRRVHVDGFWIDRHEVTNAQFAEFVDATGYVTTAERQPNEPDRPDAPPSLPEPGSAVFRTPERLTSGDILPMVDLRTGRRLAPSVRPRKFAGRP